MFKQKMILPSVSLFCTAAILAGSTVTAIPAFAAATSASLAQDIEDARVLAPGTRVRASIAKGQALISTFRNRKANDRDCKIEAVLIGKTIFDKPENEVNSITVYFYDSGNPSKYKSITVSKGDVAAFGTGQVSKSELLSSIQIREGGLSDPKTAIENQLILTAASKRQDVQISFGQDEIDVTTAMPANAPVREYKYEALRIAEIAMEKLGLGSTVKRVNVNFFNPGNKGVYKQITISTQQIETLNNQVLAALNSMTIAQKQAKVTAKDMEVADGALKKERGTLLASIQELEEMGVGVAPFIKAFQGIEAQVESTDEASLKRSVSSLQKNIEDQKERYKDAKAKKPTADSGDEGDSEDSITTGPAKTTKSKGKINRWAFGFFPMPESNILRNPDKFLKECVEKFEAKKHVKADSSPEYAWALLWFAEVLKTNDRAPEAAKYEGLAQQVTARLRSK
ncbi:MAG TPA: hypothetical protein PKC98_05600 [Candidatus Melainabacteria bacterium]|nr:hypothetical protein [Candidatus Melainabacteria bacterium]